MEGFKVETAQRLTGMHPKKKKMRKWVYPKSADVLAKTGLKIIAQYTTKRRATMAKTIDSCGVLKECRELVRRSGTQSCQMWWDQELAHVEKGANRALLGQLIGYILILH